MLKVAPMFKNMMTRRHGGAHRGKSSILRAHAVDAAGAGACCQTGEVAEEAGGAEVETGENLAERSAIADLDLGNLLSSFEVHACSVGKIF